MDIQTINFDHVQYMTCGTGIRRGDMQAFVSLWNGTQTASVNLCVEKVEEGRWALIEAPYYIDGTELKRRDYGFDLAVIEYFKTRREALAAAMLHLESIVSELEAVAASATEEEATEEKATENTKAYIQENVTGTWWSNALIVDCPLSYAQGVVDRLNAAEELRGSKTRYQISLDGIEYNPRAIARVVA